MWKNIGPVMLSSIMFFSGPSLALELVKKIFEIYENLENYKIEEDDFDYYPPQQENDNLARSEQPISVVPPSVEIFIDTDRKIMDLSTSRIGEATIAVRNAYENTKTEYEKAKKNPFVFYTEKYDYDIQKAIINMALDDNYLNETDVLYIIDHFGLFHSTNTQNLFHDIIIKYLNDNRKQEKIIALLTKISFEPKNGWFSKNYKNNEIINILAYLVELGRSNEKYIEVFNQIINLLPVDKIDSYPSVMLDQNNQRVTKTLSWWIYSQNEYYLKRNYETVRNAARTLFNRRLEQPVGNDQGLDHEFVELVSLLFKYSIITSEEHQRASMRFKRPNS